MSYGFEIGWRDRHPEFESRDPDTGSDWNDLEADILYDMSGVVGRTVTEDTTFAECGLDSLKVLKLLALAISLAEDGATGYVPKTSAELIRLKTFGNLVNYMIDGTMPD